MLSVAELKTERYRLEKQIEAIDKLVTLMNGRIPFSSVKTRKSERGTTTSSLILKFLSGGKEHSGKTIFSHCISQGKTADHVKNAISVLKHTSKIMQSREGYYRLK